MSSLPDFDFDAHYRGDGESLPGFADVPWNIGEPQPAIAELIDRGEVRSPVLDAGCGVGVTAVFLAERGYTVVGIDAAPTAVGQARETARNLGLDVELAVADLSALTGFDSRFQTVIDSAVFHAMAPHARAGYVRAIARASRPGAVLHILVFSPDAPLPSGSVNAVTEDQLREIVAEAWTIETVTATTITTLAPPDMAPQLDRDRLGRALFPALLLRAHL